MHVRVQNLSYDLRVSTIPAGRSGEKAVIRILDSNAQETLVLCRCRTTNWTACANSSI